MNRFFLYNCKIYFLATPKGQGFRAVKKMKYKMLISYDGTHYGGWQVQKNALSVQERIQTSLSSLLRTPTDLIASGRTDAGVHAKAQVAHFTHEEPLDLYKFSFALNGKLPPDIRIVSIEPTSDTFHSRFSATRKIYHYYLDVGAILNPFKKLYSYHIPYPLDIDLLKKTATYFIGTYDFTSFSNEAHKGSAAHDPVRTIYRLDIIQTKNELCLAFEGNGFLYKMVRNIVGTLLDINAKKIPLETLPDIFAAKDRRLAGRAAPPHGLFLIEVKY